MADASWLWIYALGQRGEEGQGHLDVAWNIEYLMPHEYEYIAFLFLALISGLIQP
jgi:hypothetical protein